MSMHDFEIDDATRALINRVQPYTITTAERLVALKESVEYVVRAGIPGAIIECGVWRGGSMMLAALTMMSLGLTPWSLYHPRDIWLYDTFEGMPAAGPEDWLFTGEPGTVMPVGEWKTTEDEVEVNMTETGYDMNRVHFIKGRIEETVPDMYHTPESIAILRLDTDWYSSTKHELTHLFPRLSRGGVLIIDDYGHWLGARQATDEFIAALDEPLMLHRIDYTARIAIRQGPRDV